MAQNNQNDFEERTSDLSQSLEGLNFPADKSTIVNFARSNQLDSDTLSTIMDLPERRYHDLRDVLDHFIGGTDRAVSEHENPDEQHG